MNSRRLRDTVLLVTLVIQAVLTANILRRWYGEQYFDVAAADSGLRHLAMCWLANGFGLLAIYVRRCGRTECLGVTPIAPTHRPKLAALSFFACAIIAFLGFSAPYGWAELQSYAWATDYTRVVFNVAWAISLMVVMTSLYVLLQAWKQTHADGSK